MRAIVVGTGTIGTAVKKVLHEQGHDVATVGRRSGDFTADISDIESLKSLFATIGSFDAVANAAGDVFPGPLEQTTDEQWTKSISSKGMGQINLVRAALPYIADKGSFTLVSGVLTDEYMHGGTIGTTINHLVEGSSRRLPSNCRAAYGSIASVPRFSRSPRPTTPTSRASPRSRLAKSHGRTYARCRRRSPDASSSCTRPIADHVDNERQRMRHLRASIDRGRAISGDL